MGKRKKLQELTIKGNFLFAAVMMREDICRWFLEMALGFAIERVEVSYEKSIVYHPEYKGIRLDVFAKDEACTHYNVEMQVARQPLGRRSRYYHSQIDMEMLLSGQSYEELSDSYVIFICDYDPFGQKKYRYTFDMICHEDKGICLEDGSHTVILSTIGENVKEVPGELVRFLKFVRSDLGESKRDFGDEFVSELQKTVEHIKKSREMEERFMIFEEMLRDERLQGKAGAILEILEELGNVPEALRGRILEEKDAARLSAFLKAAARAESVEQFAEELCLK